MGSPLHASSYNVASHCSSFDIQQDLTGLVIHGYWLRICS
jgi:hypothetical protein